MTTVDKMAEAPKPCPFCKSEPTVRENCVSDPGMPAFSVFCDYGREHAVFIGGGTMAEAVARWNRRAALAEHEAAVPVTADHLPKHLILAVDRWFSDNVGMGGCGDQDVADLAAIFWGVHYDGGRESVEDALAVVDSFGPGVGGLNDTFARQILLANEVKRLRAAIAPSSSQRSEPAQPTAYAVDAVAWEGFIDNYERYADGDPKMPFSELRLSLSAVIHSATARQPAQPSAPVRAVPLTEDSVWESDEIMAVNAAAALHMPTLMRLVRAVERAHGITGDQHGR